VTTLAYRGLGECMSFGTMVLSEEDTRPDFEALRDWIGIVEGLLAAGELKMHPVRVELGLEGVEGGLRDLKEGRVRGEKMVFMIGRDDGL
jgi:hypothetical protein